MKTYLFLCIFISSFFNLSAQRSTITFSQYSGLNTKYTKVLDDVYHDMKSLNYHYFDLVNSKEIQQNNSARLVQKAKARAEIITNYYVEKQGVSRENLVVVYGGSAPILSLYKSKSVLTASGNVVLEKDNQQCFDFNTSETYPFTTNAGNTFHFPPNAFETLDGKQLINENINICIWEFADKKSLVYAGVTTSANGKMLETAGSFYIEATLNGKELKLRRDRAYTVNMPSNNKHKDMFTYYGGKTVGIVDWAVDKNEPAIYNETSNSYELDDNVNIVIEEQNYDDYGETLDEEYYEEEAVNFYELSAGKLGWINCDRFYEIKNPATLAVRVNSDKPLAVRLVFRDINSVLPAYANSNHLDQYEVNGIPKGEKVLLLAYSVKDDNAIFGYKEITIGENKVENLDLNKLSKSRFEGAVSELLSF